MITYKVYVYFMTLEQGYEFGDEVRVKVYRLQAFKFQPQLFVTIDNEKSW